MKLKNYIQGRRRGKEANELERKAMQDPFLQDALDGYDLVEGNHLSNIEELEKRFHLKPQRSPYRIWAWAAAAMIAVFLGTQVYQWIQSDLTSDKPIIATTEPAIEEKNTEPLIIHEPGKSVEISKERKTIAQRTTPKKAEQSSEFEQVERIIVPKEPEESVSSNKLEELVVVGYGAQRKTAITGAVTTINDLREDTNYLAEQSNQLSFKEESVQNTLSGRVAGTQIQSSDRNIRIRGASSIPSLADSRIVKGRIIDENGEPVIGASVVLKNTNFGATTNIDGEFSLNMPNNQQGVLSASYIGYTGQEIAVSPNVGDIQLKPDLAQLDEVVVIGYGGRRQIFSKKSKTSETIKINPISISNLKPIENSKQFIQYFKDNYDKSVCSGQKTDINILVSINEDGFPSKLEIEKLTCPEMKNELIRLLESSPIWTKKGQKVKVKFEI